MAPPRILLCGDVIGRLNQLFKRVTSVNKSAGPFDALLCVGQFFPDTSEQLEEFMDYVEGRVQIPLPTYFIGDYGIGVAKVLMAAYMDSNNQGFKMDGLKICENLYWLKGSGKFNLHGLSVAYLSGRQSSTGSQYGVYSQDDVDVLRAMAEEPGIIDLCLTNEWPMGITNRASTTDIPTGISDASGCDSIISELVAEIKPRYHIAGTKGVFYAREPYSNIEALHVTRFFGLASVGNKEKQKFIHAISPTPASIMSAMEISMKSTTTTLSPYTVIEKNAESRESLKRPGDSPSESQYWRYDDPKKRQKHGAGDSKVLCFKFTSTGSCPREEKCSFQHDVAAQEQSLRGVCFDFLNKGICERGPECKFKHVLQNEDESYSQKSRRYEPAGTNRSKECWFCLSSPSVESHLIISIGESYYCALAKGPLVHDHVLIVPIEHSPTTLALASECEIELSRFKSSLMKCYKKQGMEVVFFEWVSKRINHANLQVIPIPAARAPVLQNIFDLAAQKLGFKFETVNDSSGGRKALKEKFDSNYSFFYVEVPDGKILLHLAEENERFPAQFGREVLAGLLNLANKADWRNCNHSKEEESSMAEDFKTRFQEFDPNRACISSEVSFNSHQVFGHNFDNLARWLEGYESLKS